jgi:hypothetical protein
MVLLLGYSIYKRTGRTRRRMGACFLAHMLLGILGPTAIVLHANFRLGSMNSRVALASMLLVAGSGYVGRFLYTRIYRGLAGHRIRFEELSREFQSHLERAGAASGPLADQVKVFEVPETNAAPSLVGSVLRALGAPVAAARIQWRARRELPDPTERRQLSSLVREAGRLAGFHACERLFALWHAIHLPLCVLMFAAAALHVFAVHAY